jgi:glycerophosphoryl diester phosphodiesterase
MNFEGLVVQMGCQPLTHKRTMKFSLPVIILFCFILALSACTTPALEKTPMTNSSSTKPLNIAHRGARSLAPENTIAAARKGLEIGADLWELDVAVTSDGALVVLHDDSLKRTSNAEQVFPDRSPWLVHTFTLEELRKLDFGSWFNETDPFKQIAAGAVTTEMQQSYVGEPIPTLREALVFTRDNNWRVNIEIKDATSTPGDKDVAEKVVALVEELGMVESVLISSFNHSYLERVQAANASLPTAALVESPVADPVKLVRGLNAMGYNPGIKYIRPEDIPAIRHAGVEVYIWTVNDAETMRVLVKNGVSGIFTDFPQLFKEILAEVP